MSILSKVRYAGHIKSAEGVAADPDKVMAVTIWPQPVDLKSFLGFCGYYRRFIADYERIVKPLTELTKGYAPNQRNRKADINKSNAYLKEAESFGDRWTHHARTPFTKLFSV